MAKTIPTYEWLMSFLRNHVEKTRDETIDKIVNTILDLDASQQKIVIKRLIEEHSKSNGSESMPDSSCISNQEMTAAAADAAWENNRAYFKSHENEWKEKYPGLYVAVHKENILDTDKNLGLLADRIYCKYGNIPFYASVPGEKRVEIIDSPVC